MGRLVCFRGGAVVSRSQAGPGFSLFFALVFSLGVTIESAGSDEAVPDGLDRNGASYGVGTLIVLNKGEATASLISLRDGKVVQTLPTGRGPHEAAVSPDGRLVVVGDYGQRRPGTTLSLLDLEKGENVGEIVLRPHRRPHGILFLDPKRVVVTAEVNQKLLVVDVESREVSKAIDTEARISHMVALHPGLSRAYVANIGSGSMSVIDLEKGENVSVVATGEGAEGIDVHPDGREVWVTNRAANDITILDPKSLKRLGRIECAEFPIRLKFTPDGKRALVSCAGTGDVKIVDVGSRSVIKAIPMEEKATEDKSDRLFGDQFGESPVPVGILIPPDGKRAFVANTNADVISVLDLETLELVGRLLAGKEPDGLAYSPLELDPSGS